MQFPFVPFHYVLSKALVLGPSRASLPPHKKCCICDPDSPPKSTIETEASCRYSSSQSLFFYFIFFLELTSIFFLPAHDIASFYDMSVGYPFLEMVLVLFVPSSHEDLVYLFAFISL